MADLDSILSGTSAVAPEPEVVKEPVTTPETGQEQDQPQPGDEGDGGQKMVPHEALHAEKQKVKRYTEQVAEFDRKAAEREAAWERRFTQLLETVKPKEPEKEAPDFWNDPDAYLKGALSPVQKQIETQREQFSRLMAEDKHGAETVQAAYQALGSELQSNPAARAEYQSIMQSAHPYGALVEWHKRQQAQAEIGSDPDAYKAKLRDELKAELLAELQGGSEPAAVTPAPVMPSNLAGARNVGNRSGPAWSGPQSLNDIFDRRSAKG